ncbi:unnamed protein product [Paramecium primaurelia]|uniref:Uncharacterized protein n=1 Tax=Paramecium primaurelia TaxID=5886 RepID=A0A8S1P5P6_PARPR|nr:unnamed protein product [Paramecium primaurelia]
MYCYFAQKKDLYEIFAYAKDVDEEIFSIILQKFRKEKMQDILGYLSNDGNQRLLEQYILQGQNLTQVDKEQKLYFVRNNIEQLINALKKIKDHDFNKIDYSTEENQEYRQDLVKRIKDDMQIIEFLKYLVHLISIENNLIECESNSFNLLVEMKVDMKNKNFENIKIQNASLVGDNFCGCNLSKSQLFKLDISGINLNGALLINCKWNNLRILELNKLDGHKSPIASLCFSPDCKTLASGSYDGLISLWDVKTGQYIAKLNGHSNTAYAVSFSPDGTTFAGSQNNVICLWDIKSRKIKSKFEGHSGNVSSICFSPDCRTLASCSWDSSIRLWDVQTGQLKAYLNDHYDLVFSISISPDGTTLASGGGGLVGGGDFSIRLWDVKTGQQKAKLNGHSNTVYAVSFSPDGTTLASGSRDNSICVWDVQTGQQKAKLNGHTHYVQSVCFSSDGILASGSWDLSIRLWDVKTGQQKAKLDVHTHCVQSVCFSSDGTLASGSWDKSIRLWNVKLGEEIKPPCKNYLDISLQKNLQSDGFIYNITIPLISESLLLQAKGALIKGIYINHQEINLLELFNKKGSLILEDSLNITQNAIQK